MSDVKLPPSPLPEGWSEPEVVADVVVADGVRLHRAGIASVAPTGEEITGSAADESGSPAARGFYELLERAAILEALRAKRPRYELRTLDGAVAGECSEHELFPESDDPARWRYARSNGVAIFDDWASAARRARWELVERDRILRSWYGEVAPRPLELDLAATPIAATESYDWCAHAFDAPSEGETSDVKVVGVFGFPRREGVPLVLGYGARGTEGEALDAATREALQLLAFLWGEPVTNEAPPVGPTAMHHLERFQFAGHHGQLRRWLAGAHLAHGGVRAPQAAETQVRFVDLTPAWLAGRMFVAKAYSPASMPLAFGDAPHAAHLPTEIRIHPIA
ncbi:MAG: YcaO-like family protein [Deltaproteobacteria bacterium]|nr:YcaO-like family protein [Deltaproteobacteria bacterium]